MEKKLESLTDEELVAVSIQDRQAFGVLVERFEDRLRRYIFRLGIKNADDQLDVLQEIFIKAYRNLNGFDTGLSFSSWIYRIAHNEAISWYRKHKVRPEGNMVADGDEILKFLAGKDDGVEIQFDREVDRSLLNQALLELPDKYREAILLRYFEELDYEQISDILEVPLGSVGTLLHRGKKQLAGVLKDKSLRISNS